LLFVKLNVEFLDGLGRVWKSFRGDRLLF